MNPPVMLLLVLGAHALFFWSVLGRWQLLRRPARRALHRIPERLLATWRYAFAQEKMGYYRPPGSPTNSSSAGSSSSRSARSSSGDAASTVVLFFVLEPGGPLGKVYEFAKDLVAVLVFAGVSVFFYFRVVRPQKRMTLHWEGLLILGSSPR